MCLIFLVLRCLTALLVALFMCSISFGVLELLDKILSLVCGINKSQDDLKTFSYTFCSQVLNHMRNRCPCVRWCLRRRSSMAPPMTSMTQVSTYEERRSPTPSNRQSQEESDITKLKDSNGDIMEMEEFTKTNGSITKSNSVSPTKKGDYVAVPTCQKETC